MNDSKLLNKPSDIFDKKLDNYNKWKDSFWGGLQEKWNNFLGYKIMDLKRGIKNIIKWWPILWKDGDWDDSYIFEVLKTKLIFTSKYHKKKQTYVGWERETQLMDTCIKLIKFIQDEHYEELGHDEIEKKYGKFKESDFIPIPDSDLFEWKIERENEHLYSKEEYNNDYKRIMGIAYNKHRKARKLLFRILEDHIENWWE